MKCSAVLTHVFSNPWMIHEPKLLEILEVLMIRAEGGEVPEARIQEVLAQREERERGRDRRSVGDVAVIPVLGTLINRETGMTRESGLPSVQGIMRDLRAAASDEDIASIVLDFDSPGGTAEGIPDLAAEIRRVRERKPVYGSVNGFAASAAYYLAAQCTRLCVTTSSQVGSVGVRIAHEEVSKLLEAEGRKITLITAGKHKGAGNPFEPLSEAAREDMQSTVDYFYDLMLADIAKGRHVSVAKVKQDFGEGLMVRPPEALRAGMIDAVEPTEATIAAAMADNVRRAAARRVESKRDFETFLRDAGFSRQKAKELASVGYRDQREAGQPSESALLSVAARYLKASERIEE